eukprot:11115905-Lingulodinium_polyedra.AAC.1
MLGGVTHANAPQEVAERPQAPTNSGGHGPPADERGGNMTNPCGGVPSAEDGGQPAVSNALERFVLVGKSDRRAAPKSVGVILEA